MQFKFGYGISVGLHTYIHMIFKNSKHFITVILPGKRH